MLSNRVVIFDTTLRDGEQAAGTRLGSREKLAIARQLVRLNVDVIEAGYPNSSPEDFEAVRQIAQEIEGPTICALSRAVPDDIHACGRALAGAKHPRIHTGIGSSDIHVMGKFRDERYGRTLAEKRVSILRMAEESVRLAKSYVDDVQFFAEDSGRADIEFLIEMLNVAIEAGATVLNIPDTTGYTVPEQYGGLIRTIRERVRNIDRVTISVHTHDDLGMAVSTSLAGLQNGARQVEGTINGIGERAGNASLEEVVMALHTRSDYFGLRTGIDTREFHRTSRMVADLLGIVVPPNKAVVGSNAFAHSSGIHVDGFLKDRQTYEIMMPEDVGLGESRVVLTARTGRAGLRDRLERLGYTLTADELNQTYQRFLIVADKKQEVFDEDLVAIVHDELHALEDLCQLEYLHVSSGTSAIPTATVRLRLNGQTREAASIGDGPVDAVYHAISQATASAPKLLRYEIRSVTSGAEAIGEATVQLQENDAVAIGRGASTDIIEASARAYLDAWNRLSRVAGAISLAAGH
ncbi:MAG TPA: 2-isopropylmalate synthase [Bryobacteraceae bacterium]|nr:2-isopropylmalate synthase [Bryobacteraceae bacterium]